MAEPLTPARLQQWGEAIFGENWKAPLAREIEVNERTIKRWMAGTTGPIKVTEAELRAVAKRVNQKRAERVRELG